MNLRKALKLGPTCERGVRGELAGIWDRASQRLSPVFHNDKEEIWLNTRLPDTTLATLLTDHPAASTPLGTTVIIDEPPATGLTTPPTSTKMSRIELINSYLVDGTTRAWRPRGVQTVFARGGSASNAIISATTGTGAPVNIGDLFTVPASLFALADTVVEFAVLVERTAGSTGTPTHALVLGTQAIGTAPMTANANSVAYIEGKFFVRTSTTQFSSYSISSGGSGTVKAQGVNASNLTLTNALTFSVQQVVASGGGSDAMAVVGVSITMHGA